MLEVFLFCIEIFLCKFFCFFIYKIMFENFEFVENANLSKLSTMKTGGKAKYIIFPKNVTELRQILKIIKKNGLKSFIIGNCSNILFSDYGFDGVLISLKHFDKIKKTKNFVEIGAGINLFALNQKLALLGLSGMEWSFGIPGSFGGLIYMNGGCFGSEVFDFVESIKVLDGEKIKILKKAEIKFAYRATDLKGKIILSAKLKLKSEESEKILKKMQFFLKIKHENQPCDFPSLGSIFKQIKTDEKIIYPAKIIDNLGLKGFKIKRAEISKKHAGFIVNSGNATSDEIFSLICFVQKKLAEQNVFPELEIILLGEFNLIEGEI